MRLCSLLTARICLVFLIIAFASGNVSATDEIAVWKERVTELEQSFGRSSAQGRSQLAIAYNNYAIALGNAGEWTAAENYLQKAMSISGESTQFKDNLVAMYINRAAEMLSDTQRTSYSREMHREAKQLVERAIQMDPDSDQAHLLMGDIHYDNQRLTEAKRSWEQALRLAPGNASIKERLSRVNQEAAIENEFDKIHNSFFDLRFEDGVERTVGFDIESALMKARRDVGTDFRYYPKRKFIVLLYNGDTFRRMRQGTPEWVAGQFDGKIRLPLPDRDYPEAIVKQIVYHEYTHAILGDLMKVRIPIWFNEGLAEYQGAAHGIPEIQFLEAAHAQDALVDWSKMELLFSKSRRPEEIALGYQQAHSVVAFLIQRYGFWRMRQLLDALNEGTPIIRALEEEYNSPVERLEKSWQLWLPKFLAKRGKH